MLKKTFSITLALIVLLTSGSAVSTTAQTSGITVISSDTQKVVIDFTVPHYEVETLTHNGIDYQRFIIADMVQSSTTGEPQLPTTGSWVGVPTIEGVTLTIIKADYKTLDDTYRIYPAPGTQVVGEGAERTVENIFSLNSEAYQTDTLYPGAVAQLGDTGFIREQAVAQLLFYPVQYNPVTGKVTVYTNIQVEISWDATVQPRTQSQESSYYQNILKQTILNYQPTNQASRPTSPRQSDDDVKIFLPAIQQVNDGPLPAPNQVKLMLNEDGLYRVSFDELREAGFDVTGLNLSKLKLYNQGIEVPITVDSSGFLFYGTAIDDIYTTENVYWVSIEGNLSGERIDFRDGTPNNGTTPTQFMAHYHGEENSYFYVEMPDSAGKDFWLWADNRNDMSVSSGNDPDDVVGKVGGSKEDTFTLPFISSEATTATMTVQLYGRTDTQHRTVIYINETQVDEQTWSGQGFFDQTFTFNATVLQAGENKFRVEVQLAEAQPDDNYTETAHLNWYEINYFAPYQAVNDKLMFKAPTAGTFQFEVTGFSNDNIRLFDVTIPNRLVEITDFGIVEDGNSFKLQFQDTAEADTQYLAISNTQYQTADRFEQSTASTLASTQNQADYLIITHQDFYTSAQRLAEHRRQNSNLTIKVIKVQQLYDDFNYGIFNPNGIRNFLTFAYENWQKPAPTFALLVGDANWDYKNYRGAGPTNYVPSQLIETKLGQTPSDNWFALLSGDDVLPDLMMGRLAPQSSDEADLMVDKIIGYDQTPPADSWNKNVLLIADDGTNRIPDDSFFVISEKLADILPSQYSANKIYYENYPPSNDPIVDTVAHINNGSLLVNYAGHGAVDFWGRWNNDTETAFQRTDIADLTNANRLPMVTVANCLSGLFTLDAGASRPVAMAEELLRVSNKGAVAVWAPTGVDFPDGHLALMSNFYKEIFYNNRFSLGQTTTQAKYVTYGQNNQWTELVDTFILFGDPTQNIGVASENMPYVESTTPENNATNIPLDQPIIATFNKPMNPATVDLQVTGTDMAFTTSWNADFTQVTYTGAANFDEETTITATISGQDAVGNALIAGPIPNSWSFTTATSVSMASVEITGPITGTVNQEYGFTATISPISASGPFTYTWEATDLDEPIVDTSENTSNNVTLDWVITGTKAITITVADGNSTVSDSRIIPISENINQ